MIDILNTGTGWAVVKEGKQVEEFPPTEAGYFAARVLYDLLTEPEPLPEPEPEPKEEPKPLPEPYPFPPGVNSFWWPKSPGATLTGSYDGVYDPNNGDNLKLVIRRGPDRGYLVAFTRSLRHAFREARAEHGDIVMIEEAGKGLLVPSDRGPSQLFNVTVVKRRDERSESYEPGVN